MTRDELLKTFNDTFYFAITTEHTWEQRGSDVFDAMVKMLEHFALFDQELTRKQSIEVIYCVSLNPLGPWISMPVGPAYRQCSPVVRQIVEYAVRAKHGDTGEYLLEQADVDMMDKVSDGQLG